MEEEEQTVFLRKVDVIVINDETDTEASDEQTKV